MLREQGSGPGAASQGRKEEPPAHPKELAYPCCRQALGELGKVSPRGGPGLSVRDPAPPSTSVRPLPPVSPGPVEAVRFRAEDSPRGLWRSLGKRVGFTPSRVRISYPPPRPPGEALRHPSQ